MCVVIVFSRLTHSVMFSPILGSSQLQLHLKSHDWPAPRWLCVSASFPRLQFSSVSYGAVRRPCGARAYQVRVGVRACQPSAVCVRASQCVGASQCVCSVCASQCVCESVCVGACVRASQCVCVCVCVCVPVCV